jgi:uncharacterized repeat protein (TIGR01451 family)
VGLIPVQAAASNVCPNEKDGWTEHFGPNIDGDVEYDAPPGYIVDSVCIKGGSEGSSPNGYLETFSEDGWYEVTYMTNGNPQTRTEVSKNCVGASGIGSATANAMHGDAPGNVCGGISHASFKLARVQGEELVCTPGVNLLKNADFETPLVTTVQNWDIVPDGTAGLDWKVEWNGGSTPFETVERPEIANLELHKGVNGWLPQTGAQYAELDADWFGPINPLNNEPASVKISQEIPTIPGYEYKVEYHFSPRPGTAESENKLVSTWAGNALDTHMATGGGNTSWTKYSKTVEATSSSAVLAFMDDGTPNSLGTFIDNVSVECVGAVPTDTPTPEPTNTPTPTPDVCTEGPKWASSIVDGTVQGTNKDGSVVLVDRSNPNNALGAADGKFFSLGKDGVLMVEFEYPVLNKEDMMDISVHEITNGRSSYPVEKAKVEVSLDGVTYLELGEATNKANTSGDASGQGGDGVSLFDLESVGLPAAKYIKVTDTTEYAIHINSADGFDIDAIDATYGLCEDREFPNFADVTVCKQDDRQNYLPGWNVQLLGEMVDSVEVLPDDLIGGSITPEESIELAKGDYVLLASGAYKYRGGTDLKTDAGYSERLESDGFTGPYAPWINVMDLTTTGALGVMVNGNPTDWGYYSPSHNYALGYMDFEGKFSFTSIDNNISDNSGSMNVDIYKGYAGITAENGCITFEDVPYGNYTTDEILMKDWENINGKGTEVEVNDPTETFMLVNRPPMGTIEGLKYEDANADGDRDDGENGLEDWQIVIKPETLEPVQELQVPTNSIPGVNSLSLTNDRVYLIEASGVWDNANGRDDVDAEYWSRDGWSTIGDFENNPSYDPREIDLVVDNENINWGAYNEQHLYKTVLMGEGSTVNFRIYDYNLDESVSWYNDNVGSLTVKIYDVTDYVVETDEMGEYSKDLMNGEYQVVEINQPGWIQTAPSGPSYCHLTVENGSTETCEFGNTRMGSIDGYKILDTDGDGTLTRQDERLAGWEINLWTGDENAPLDKIQTKTTDDDGYYKFENLLPGIYWLNENQKEGWTQTAGPEVRGPLIIQVGTDLHGNNFGNFELGSVAGYKWEDLNGDGIMNEDESSLLEDWKITLEKLEDNKIDIAIINSIPYQMTDEKGNYEFEDLYPGKYKLCEEMQEGWMQTYPNNQDISRDMDSKCHYVEINMSGQNLVNYNFGNFELGKVSGYKWDDDNGDGLKDYGEPKMAGWTIELHKTEPSDAQDVAPYATVETDEFGDYEFSDLMPGTYYLKEVAKAGQQDWVQTFPSVSSYYTFEIQTSGDVEMDMVFGNNLTADLEVTKTTQTTSALPNSQITYDVSVINVGTEDIGIEGVNIWDDLPEGVVYSSSSPEGTYNDTLRRVSWVIPSLAVDEVWTATVTVTVPTDFDTTILEITNRVEAMRSCLVTSNFSTTLAPSIVEFPEPVIEFCESDPTPDNNIDNAVVAIATVAGTTDDETESTGNIQGLATSRIGQVMGASNSLSATGRNILTSLFLGMLLMSGLAFVNFKKTKRLLV